MTRSLPSNATYSALQFTISQYGAYNMTSDVMLQQGFKSEEEMVEAAGGDAELHKAIQKWQDHFYGAAVKGSPDEYDLTPGNLNYVSPTPKKYSGLASGMRFTRST